MLLYKVGHLQSGIRFVSPSRWHAGQNSKTPAARNHVSFAAQAAEVLEWQHAEMATFRAVSLNPEDSELAKTK